MFFPDEPVPVEVVRELAALLQANGLSEISLESKGEENALRLSLQRETFAYAPAPLAAPVALSATEIAEAEAPESEVFALESTEARDIVAPCVGVYRTPKKPLQIGDSVRAGQVVAIVESLRVPNEVVAPFDGTVIELPSLEGQGVEWGQTLLVLEPAS